MGRKIIMKGYIFYFHLFNLDCFKSLNYIDYSSTRDDDADCETWLFKRYLL